MRNSNVIIKNIKLYLKQNKMTQAALAEKMQIAPSLLSQMLKGTRKIQTKHLIKLAEITNKTITELVETDLSKPQEPIYSLRGRISTQAGSDHLVTVVMDIEHYLALGDEN